MYYLKFSDYFKSMTYDGGDIMCIKWLILKELNTQCCFYMTGKKYRRL